MIGEVFKHCLTKGIPDELPNHPGIDPSVPHAPKRSFSPSKEEFQLAIENALRYFPQKWHAQLAKEFAEELVKYGHIYMFRFRPVNYEMKAYAVENYTAKSKQGIMLEKN